MKHQIALLFLFSTLTGLMSCDRDIDYDNADLMRLTLSVDTLIADDYTVCLVMIELDSNLSKRSGQTISFSSSLGSFPFGATATTDGTGKASVYFKSDKTGIANIHAKLDDFSVSDNIILSEAWPDQILATCDSIVLHNTLNNNAQMIATARRTNGSPTDGLFISFRAFDSTGVTKGTFVNNTATDNEDIAKADFHLLDTTYSGMLYYKAIFQFGNTTVESDTNTIFILN